MGNITIAEILLAMNAGIVALNLISMYRSSRTRAFQTEPIIQAIKEEMAVIKNEMIPKKEIVERLSALEMALKMCQEQNCRNKNEK